MSDPGRLQRLDCGKKSDNRYRSIVGRDGRGDVVSVSAPKAMSGMAALNTTPASKDHSSVASTPFWATLAPPLKPIASIR